jgi:type IV pilus assembly protein PilB
MRFGDLAIKMGFMTQEQLNYVLSKKNISRQMLGQLCIEEGLLEDEKLAKVIAAQYGCEYLLLEGVKDPALLELIPMEMMQRYGIIPYDRRGDQLLVATSDPVGFLTASYELEMIVDAEIVGMVASEKRLKALLKKIESSQNLLGSAWSDIKLPLVRESDKGDYVLDAAKVSEEESPIVRVVDSTILDAINKGVSDIHIETADQGVVIRYRINGMLHQATDPLGIQYQSQIISRIKVMSELDISEKRVPQDGRFKLKVKDRFIDFRISILPTIFGEDAVIRILDREGIASETGSFNLDEMGLPPDDLLRLRRMIHAPYGMFLMTGPTGSGKTTTLYRALSEVNSKDVKIITIEDPVEYQIPGIVQIPVNEKKGLTFSRGLRSILRHDPDKILVGEIRDAETAQIAMQSALTGHMVFTTVHANRSFDVIHRFTNLGLEPYNLVSALNCIAAQRLIRNLCACKIPQRPEKGELIEAGLEPELYLRRTFFREKGCEECKGTGFKGRKAILELIVMDDELREMFIHRAPVAAMKRAAIGNGTTFLRKAALLEVFKGETTLREANRVTLVEVEE